MIEIKDKKDCCGCGACVQRCPKHCILMHEDEEGFLYPKADASICIECGLCEKVCPVINRGMASSETRTFAVKNRNINERELSSSGGLFIVLARQTIQAGGVVFGVVFDEQWQVHHVAATTEAELLPMMRSKYVQSRTENTFCEAEKYLRQGRKVLFTGTSCQIAGLRRFLRKNYENLLTVDVLCHGVPSPGVWRRYLEELVTSAQSAAIGKNTVLNVSLKSMSAIADISFREKHRSGYNWEKYGFVVWQKSVSKTDKNSVLSSYMFAKNPYMRGFLSDIFLRPSCYACPAKGGTSGADITIADFWGIEKVLPDFTDDSGVGLAFVHTAKGTEVFNTANFDIREVKLEQATQSNPSYWVSKEMPLRLRKKFFTLFQRNVSVRDSVDKSLKETFTTKIIRIIKKIIKLVLPVSILNHLKEINRKNSRFLKK